MSTERSAEVMATYLGEVLGNRRFELIPSFVGHHYNNFPLAQSRGRDGHRHGKDTKAKHHQIKKGKGKLILN